MQKNSEMTVYTPSTRAKFINMVKVPTVLAMAAFGSFASAQEGGAANGELTQANFTAVGTKLLTYFGYGLVAALAVIAVVVAGKAGLAMIKRLVGGAAH